MKREKHVVIYEIKNSKKELLTLTKSFDDLPAACSFFREIKFQSVTRPILDTITN